MISPDVRIVDVDGDHWTRLFSLFRKRERANGAASGWLLLFTEGDRLVKAVHLGRGEVDPASIAWQGQDTPLAPLRLEQRAARVFVIPAGSLSGFFADAEGAIDPTGDMIEQWLAVLRAGRGRIGSEIRVDPRVFARFPIPSYDRVQRTFDRLWPDDHSLVFYVMDEAQDDVHTSLILAKEEGDVSLVTTHLSIARDVRMGRTWRRQHRRVLEAVRERFAPPYLGIFLDRTTFERLQNGSIGSTSAAIARRHVIVDPAPAWMLGLITTGFVAGAVRKLGAALGVGDATRMAGARAFGALGFDPRDLWRTWRRRP